MVEELCVGAVNHAAVGAAHPLLLGVGPQVLHQTSLVPESPLTICGGEWSM